MRKILEALQPLGRALMLPIAVLPIAGLLLRRASMTRLVSSIDRVVWVTKEIFSGLRTCNAATSFSSSTR